jgi:hypothetical protein
MLEVKGSVTQWIAAAEEQILLAGRDGKQNHHNTAVTLNHNRGNRGGGGKMSQKSRPRDVAAMFIWLEGRVSAQGCGLEVGRGWDGGWSSSGRPGRREEVRDGTRPLSGGRGGRERYIKEVV